GELTCQSSKNSLKLYKDYLNSALAAKAYLNTVLRCVPYLPAANIKTFVARIIWPIDNLQNKLY
ncbi:hypothetical protein BD408DRAFT_472680, partial [Parasitella parasitica]